MGNYEGALDEAESARIDVNDSVLSSQREFFIQRAKLAKGGEQIKGGSSLELKALMRLAALTNGTGGDAELAALKRAVDEDASGNEGLRIVAGIAFYRFGSDPNEALRILRSAKNSLEAMHVSTAILIAMDRNDLAKKQLERMQELDEDATLTQLSSAWVALTSGTETGVKDAAYALEELIGKWQATPLLVGALTCALIYQGKFAEAEKAIAQCSSNTPELTVNRIVAAQHSGRRLDEYIVDLKRMAPSHVWFYEMSKQSEAFDRAAATFSA